MGKLENKAVIITGGASGMGKASVQIFAEEGAKIVFADINEEKGKQIEADMRNNGYEVFFQKADISKEEECKALVDATVNHFGTIDVVYNSVGIDISKPFLEYDAGDFEKIMKINVFGPIFVDKYAAEYMIKQGKPGVIVNTGSTCSISTNPCNAFYTASKGAVIAVSRAMAVDLAPYNIRVNTLCPGHTRTEMMEGFLSLQPDAEKAHDELAATVPLRRMAKPEEQARVALFLASDDSSYVTGTSILSDGGLLNYFA